jgi:hypothetical protein
MLEVFFNPKEFAMVDFLPQDTFFTAGYFVNNMTLPLANRHAQQLGDLGRRILHLHVDNSKGQTTGRVQEQIASHRCVRVPQPPHSLDLVSTDFYLFVILRGVFLFHCDGEENVTVSQKTVMRIEVAVKLR